MSTLMTPQQFVNKWKAVELKESSAAREHFNDICRLIGHPTPVEYDKKGEVFCFEKGATKESGGRGFADVWFKDHFGWEYKSKGADLDAAYKQLLQYRESLENPWLLIVSDMARIIIHTNFPNTVNREITLTLDDLLMPTGREPLRLAFFDPAKLEAKQTTEQVTQEAAKEFSRLADHLRKWGEDPQEIARFLIRILFCLFAEDIGLLPRDLFTRLAEQTSGNTQAFTALIRQLFSTMSTGGWFGADEIPHFDGGLFDDDRAVELDSDGIAIVNNVTKLDWASIDPAIIGTLFERSLDPAKRAQLGVHYTSREDILLIVEPVLMAPFRRRWSVIQDKAYELAARRDKSTDLDNTELDGELTSLLTDFASDVSQVRVLDPACGSGNFLYVALRQLLDLEKEIIILADTLGIGHFEPRVSPHQLYGIEINEYAHELAQTTVWIGYIQWLHENGFEMPYQPILQPMENIKQMDALLSYDNEGRPMEPNWPEAEVVVSNPPFLGGKKIRGELGDKISDDLLKLYGNRLHGESDLVCYWFERVRKEIARNQTMRAGMIATSSIRGRYNRGVLQRIKKTGDLFWAWNDRPWILEGADVRVAMIGFDNGTEKQRTLNGVRVVSINADLSSKVDLTDTDRLRENYGLSFQGINKVGPFDIDNETARKMLADRGNPNNRSNSKVVKPYVNAMDITRRPRGRWIIDFSVKMSLEEAAQFEKPFEYLLQNVKPKRDKVRRKRRRELWWLFGETCPGLRAAIKPLKRYIVTPAVAKHRIFAWLPVSVVPDHRLMVIARQDDYFFGVLHSQIHELWSLRRGARHGVGNDPVYGSRTTFETFPMPWIPIEEPKEDVRMKSIAKVAQELAVKRDLWLSPEGATKAELKKLTLTNLYNEMPMWLELVHKKLDEAVLDAYGWPHDLSDEEILERLLALNLERAGKNA